MKRVLPLLLILFASACSTTNPNEPSLAPRAAEKIDPRVPVDAGDPTAAPVDAELAATVSSLVAGAISASAEFDAAAPAAEKLVDVAGVPQSESWIAAQQAVSALEGLRAPMTTALSRLDDIAATRVERTGGIIAPDQALLDRAHADLDAINGRQAALVATLSARLGG